MCLAGKLGCRGVVAAVRPGRHFFVTDSQSQRRFLVDTNSAYSIMPWQSVATPAGPSLSGADGRRIPCWGGRSFTVTIGGIPSQWVFLLAAISFPILGVDFLRHHSLLVEVANLRLSLSPAPVNAVIAGQSYADAIRLSPASPPGAPPGSPSLPPASSAAVSPPLAAVDWLAALQCQFSKVFFQDAAASSLVLAHGVHHIKMVGQPASAKFRQLDLARLAAAK
jgi:hypothetical protein